MSSLRCNRFSCETDFDNTALDNGEYFQVLIMSISFNKHK